MNLSNYFFRNTFDIVDLYHINSFKSHLQKIVKQGWVFYGSPLKPMSLTCGLTTAEAVSVAGPV